MVLLDSMSPYEFTDLPGFATEQSMMRRGLGVLPSLARLGVARILPTSAWSSLPEPAASQVQAFAASARGMRNMRDEQSMYRTVFEQAKALTSLDGKPLVVVTATESMREARGVGRPAGPPRRTVDQQRPPRRRRHPRRAGRRRARLRSLGAGHRRRRPLSPDRAAGHRAVTNADSPDHDPTQHREEHHEHDHPPEQRRPRRTGDNRDRDDAGHRARPLRHQRHLATDRHRPPRDRGPRGARPACTPPASTVGPGTR